MENNTFSKYDFEEEASYSKRLRIFRHKGKELVDQGILSEQDYQLQLNKILVEEAERRQILNILKDGPSIISQISKITGIEQQKIVKHMIALIKFRKVAILKNNGEEYIYGLI